MEKKFNEISCVYCGALNHSEDENCITCLNKLNIQESLIGHKLNSYELTKYIARGFYGLTYKAEDIYSKKVFHLHALSLFLFVDLTINGLRQMERDINSPLSG